MSRNDGKYLEDLVKEWYAIHGEKRLDITLKRLPDSYAARKGIAAQNADFLLSRRGFGAFHLECKSVGADKLHLSMFSQYPTMRMWDLAGTHGFVLVHFYKARKIVIESIETLGKMGMTGKHWDLSFSKYIVDDSSINYAMDGLMLMTGGLLK